MVIARYEKEFLLECIDIYEANKDWLLDFAIQDEYVDESEKYVNEDPESTLLYFNEYKRLKGKDDFEKYKERLRMFFRITSNAYISGDCSKQNGEEWNGSKETWQCFVGYIGKIKEAKRYFASVDNIHAYS